MKYCAKCGNAMDDQAIACPNCGCAVAAVDDRPSTGLNVLAFLIPLVGLILYCVNINKSPIKAKKIGKWALIGFIVGIVISVIYYAIIFAAIAAL